MTTIEEKLKKGLFDCGMFEQECEVVIEAIKTNERNEAMQGRWQDNADNYPSLLLLALWLSVR